MRGNGHRRPAPRIAGVALLAAVVTLVAARGGAQEPAPESIPARVKVRVAVPLFVATRLETSFLLTQTRAAGESRSFRHEHREEREFIDELIAFDAEREESTRTILRAAAQEGGEGVDPGLEGVTIRYLRTGKEKSLRIDGDRNFSPSDLADFLQTFESTGIWLEMPDSWALGATQEIDLRPLAPLLLGEELRYRSAIAKLALDSIDRESSRSILRGSLTVEAIRPAAPGETELVFHAAGSLELRLDHAGHRIEEVSFRGEGRIEGVAGALPRIEGEGTIRALLETRIAGDAAERRAAAPVFRPALRAAGSLGLALTVPSHWMPADTKNGMFALSRSLEKSRGRASILLFPMDRPSAVPSAYFQFVEQLYAARGIAFEKEEVESPLGKGCAYRIVEEEEGRRQIVRTELYPWRERWVHFQLIADETHFDAALPEFIAARGTLRSWSPPQVDRPAPPPVEDAPGAPGAPAEEPPGE